MSAKRSAWETTLPCVVEATLSGCYHDARKRRLSVTNDKYFMKNYVYARVGAHRVRDVSLKVSVERTLLKVSSEPKRFGSQPCRVLHKVAGATLDFGVDLANVFAYDAARHQDGSSDKPYAD